MRALLVLAPLVLLAACEQPQEPASAPAETPAAPAPETPAPGGVQAGLKWDAAVSGAGMSLTLSVADGAPVLRLACARDPAEMSVLVESFRVVPSEERLSFGVDDEPFVFVADTMAARPTGVEAKSPINPDLLARLEKANAVSASYGAQSVGPHLPPDPETARRFAEACRQIAGR